MRIIEIVALDNGAHRNQTWDSSVPPDGYAVIRDDMETPNFPFGDIVVEEVDGIPTVTAWMPGEMPEPIDEPDPEPDSDPVASVWEALDAAYQEGVNDV